MANYKEKLNPWTWEFNLVWKAEGWAWDYVTLDNNWKVPANQTYASSWCKFLSLWDCTTWMPISFPLGIPYNYTTWDYFIVETVWTRNYKPDWDKYTWTASRVVESWWVAKWDAYMFDWITWILQVNHWWEVSFANLVWEVNDNAKLQTAFNWVQQNINTVSWTVDWLSTTVDWLNTTVWWIQTSLLSKVDNVTTWTTSTSNKIWTWTKVQKEALPSLDNTTLYFTLE